jgi:hypothetical protein
MQVFLKNERVSQGSKETLALGKRPGIGNPEGGMRCC